jgi:outer membrane protease
MIYDYKREEIKEHFKDFLNENKDYLMEHEGDSWTDDLHHKAFNEDYYIVGTYKATKWLGEMAFSVIGHIKDYEESNFGEVYTDLSDPEKVVNMYTYIVGEEIVNEYIDNLTDELLEREAS